jgi:hypothetical protein
MLFFFQKKTNSYENFLTISNKLVFSLKAPTQPQNPITKTKSPTTKNTNAGSNSMPTLLRIFY